MEWVYHDGGRVAAGYPREDYGACVTRAIAIATGQPYRAVYDAVNEHCWKMDWRPTAKRSSAPTGVPMNFYGPYLRSLGWQYTPCPRDTHFTRYELPPGILLVHVKRHLCCVKNGVLYDTWDCSRQGFATVEGYWRKVTLDNNVIML